jgi:nitrate reductase gamma subunit
MEIGLHVITYASIAVFLLAVGVRFIRIQKYPLNLRWEIYPVPHEGARAAHGGSRLEVLDWWEKSHKPSRATELRYMIPEMLFLQALYENNRKLWYRSFPFHFGLYILIAFGGLLVLGSILSLLGIPVGADAGSIGMLVSMATVIAGGAGIALTLLGGIGLLLMRFSDEDLIPYTNPSHIFNLVFFIGALVLLGAAWLLVDKDFSLMRAFITSMLTFDLTASTGSGLVSATILVLALLVAYVPLTHMSHFFVKWFTWHKIRWDDEPNVKGGRIEVLIEKSLQYPVSWSADHVNADGKKTWADIATEEMDKS